jgi:hypothetical protein
MDEGHGRISSVVGAVCAGGAVGRYREQRGGEERVAR